MSVVVRMNDKPLRFAITTWADNLLFNWQHFLDGIVRVLIILQWCHFHCAVYIPVKANCYVSLDHASSIMSLN